MRYILIALLVALLVGIGFLGLAAQAEDTPSTRVVVGVARDGGTATFTPSPTLPPPTATPVPPTATPLPVYGELTRSELRALLYAAGWPEWEHNYALRVAYCESGYDGMYHADAVGGVGERGIFQLRPEYHQWRANIYGGNMFNALTNVQAALHLRREQGWQPWSCA